MEFYQKLQEARSNVKQTREGIALLLNMDLQRYTALENKEYPTNEELKNICQLFKWNFNETNHHLKKKSQKNNHISNQDTSHLSFSETLKQARLDASQTIEGISLLLNIPSEVYLEYENGKPPSEENLKKMSSLFKWNYFNLLNKLKLESTKTTLAGKMSNWLSIHERDEFNPATTQFEFHTLLKTTRLKLNASLESVAILLQISEQQLTAIEEGEVIPNKEILKKITAIFQWNYFDLQNLLRKKEQSNILAKSKEPTQIESEEIKYIREICNQLAKDSQKLKSKDLKIIKIQLQLIQQTTQKLIT